jgi:hypothetical protein
MARRLVRDTYGFEMIDAATPVRRSYKAGAEIPDAVQLEDPSAAEDFDKPARQTGYKPDQIAEGATSDHSKLNQVATEEVNEDGNVVRRTRTSKEAAQGRRERSRTTGEPRESVTRKATE